MPVLSLRITLNDEMRHKNHLETFQRVKKKLSCVNLSIIIQFIFGNNLHKY